MERLHDHVRLQLELIDALKQRAAEYEQRNPADWDSSQEAARLKELRTIGLHWPRQTGKTRMLLERLKTHPGSVMIFYWSQMLDGVRENANEVCKGAGERVFSYKQLLDGSDDLISFLSKADEVYLVGVGDQMERIWNLLAGVCPKDVFLIFVN